MTTHIVLLRGINVGKHNRIAMAELRSMLTNLGYTAVSTLLNSGNAVVTTPVNDPSAVALSIHEGIKEKFGLSIVTIVRSKAQIQRVIERNPMPAEAEQSPKFFHVGFCESAPTNDALDVVDKEKIAPNKAVLDEGTLYLWFANGLHDSSLARALSTHKLDRNVTMRNWNTVQKLLDTAEN